MSQRCPLVQRLRRARVVAAAPLLALVLSACARAVPTTDVPSSVPPVPRALATSLQAPGGTWATLPMGRLDDPLNTFWQLFFRPKSSAEWSDYVEHTATATNGGLVMASSGNLLAVAVLPFYDLKFTPLIYTSDSGKSWSTGLFDHTMAPVPNALAIGAQGRALAIARQAHGEEVFSAPPGLSSWQPLVSQAALASQPAGKPCEPAAFTSVAYMGTSAIIGARCARPGVAGLFVGHSGTWAAASLKLPPSLSHSLVSVLGLGPAQGRLVALLSASSPSGTNLFAAWPNVGLTWEASAPLAVHKAQHLVSYGPAPHSGAFALLSGRGGSEQLWAASERAARGAPWRQLRKPPAGTATVAYVPGGTLDALAVSSTVLNVWALRRAGGGWAKYEVVHVPIQFGSSSP
jgi:hypothetical protein